MSSQIAQTLLLTSLVGPGATLFALLSGLLALPSGVPCTQTSPVDSTVEVWLRQTRHRPMAWLRLLPVGTATDYHWFFAMEVC